MAISNNQFPFPRKCILQIVPTLYKFQNGTSIVTNQYSVTEHLRHVNPGGGRGLPGVFFFYEISPLHVEIVEGYRKGYIAFFTSVCAIVGGVVTTFGLLDQFLYSLKHGGGGAREGLVL
jgi:endoplasmic reticulum-Golgi intermediate compartment protein 3